MTTVKRQVVTILSCNFSGSHFLSLMLGSHSRAEHIGEVRSRRRTYNRPRLPCTLCDEPAECPVVRGITPETIDQVYHTVFDNFDRPTLTTLVDASKKVDWARRFVGDPSFGMRYIHLIRDPRALVRRWLLRYRDSRNDRMHERLKSMRRRPARAPVLLAAPQWKVYLHRWLNENREITRFLTAHRLEHLVVTYREAALEPEAALSRIMHWLDLDYEPGQTDYWNFDHHGTQKRTYDWVKKDKTRYFDQRWRKDLTPKVQSQIAANADVHRYLDQLALDLQDHGLHRRPTDNP